MANAQVPFLSAPCEFRYLAPEGNGPSKVKRLRTLIELVARPERGGFRIAGFAHQFPDTVFIGVEIGGIETLVVPVENGVALFNEVIANNPCFAATRVAVMTTSGFPILLTINHWQAL